MQPKTRGGREGQRRSEKVSSGPTLLQTCIPLGPVQLRMAASECSRVELAMLELIDDGENPAGSWKAACTQRCFN